MADNEEIKSGVPEVGLPTAAQAVPPEVGQLATLWKGVASAGSWFYFIAVLSAVNTVIAAFHGSWHFLIGLGITTVLDSLARDLSALAVIILPINLLIASTYFFLGYKSCRHGRWALISGTLLYGIDTLIVGGLLLLKFGSPITLIFHIYALVCIAKGLKFDSEARALEARLKVTNALQFGDGPKFPTIK